MATRYSLSEKEKEIILANARYICDLLIDYIKKYDETNIQEAYIEDALHSFNEIKELFEDEEDEEPHKPTQAEIEEFYADDMYDEMKIGGVLVEK